MRPTLKFLFWFYIWLNLWSLAGSFLLRHLAPNLGYPYIYMAVLSLLSAGVPMGITALQRFMESHEEMRIQGMFFIAGVFTLFLLVGTAIEVPAFLSVLGIFQVHVLFSPSWIPLPP